jgi:hypothetical protein
MQPLAAVSIGALSEPLPGGARDLPPQLTHPSESAPSYVKTTAAESGSGRAAEVFSI